MSSIIAPLPPPFVDRREHDPPGFTPTVEHRQFANGYAELSPEACELGTAVDQYKWQHRRRLIDWEELLAVLKSLGYSKHPAQDT